MLKNIDAKKSIVYIFTILLSIVFFIGANRFVTGGESVLNTDSDQKYIRGEVSRIISSEENEYGDRYTVFTVETEDAIITATQVTSDIATENIRRVEVGDDIIVMKSFNSSDYYFSEHVRSDGMIILGIIFALLLILFGRSKGVNTILSLAFTCISIFYVMIPAILMGKNVYLWTSITCIYITASTLLLVNGANKKSLAAGIGCIGGVLVAFLLAWGVDVFIKMSGYIDENAVYLATLKHPVDPKSIIYASVLIGAIGAIMDVAVELSASLSEIAAKLRKVSFKELFLSGMNIGRETMGTMSNTLVLAYIGGSLSNVILMVANSSSMLYLFNMESVIFELLQALAGSIGILFCIPLTSMICGVLFKTE